MVTIPQWNTLAEGARRLEERTCVSWSHRPSLGQHVPPAALSLASVKIAERAIFYRRLINHPHRRIIKRTAALHPPIHPDDTRRGRATHAPSPDTTRVRIRIQLE